MGLRDWLKSKQGEGEHPTLDYYGSLYEQHIQSLQQSGLSRDEALQTSVGGDFKVYGKIERDLLLGLGLHGGSSIVDVGCGAGRLAQFVGEPIGPTGKYLGLDVHPGLLDQARENSAKGVADGRFRFEIVSFPHIPAEDESADLVCAFSVATHIDLEETYSYMVEVKRVLKPNGKSVISYLSTDIQDHWSIFLTEADKPVEERHSGVRNHVMPPGTLNAIASHAGLNVLADIRADQPSIVLSESVTLHGRDYRRGESIHFGQSYLVLSPNQNA